MRYHLRTLLIVLALGPPLLAGIWFGLSALRIAFANSWPEQRQSLLEQVGGMIALIVIVFVAIALNQRMAGST
jgi:hypothetical protein